MNHALLVAVALLAGVSFARVDDTPSQASDREAVIAAALDYVEGIYEVAPERVARSVHPELAKYGFGRRKDETQYRGMAMTYDELVALAGRYNKEGAIPADEVLTYNLEASWRKGPFWLAYEYIHSNVESKDHGDLEFDGQHIAASWAITGIKSLLLKSGPFTVPSQ